jgi:Tfp pilus assembly PilM family ATPase
MSLLASLLASSPPDAAIEIASEAVSVAVLGSRGLGRRSPGEGGANPVVQAYAVVPLPRGAVVPSLLSMNIVDRGAVAQAVRTACERVGQRPRRAALVIPDLAARVSLVRFDQIPARREDLDQLIRWQIKKSSPFSVEDACLTHSPGVRSGAGGEFVVVAARRETVREYESVCDDAGIYAGLVDISTMSVVNLYLASGAAPGGDWLVVHMRQDYTSIALMRGKDLLFFRNRAEGEEEALMDVLHQTAMYYQDRLAGQGFERVLAGGSSLTPGGVELTRRDLETRLGTPVEPLDPSRIAPLTDRITTDPGQAASLAPLVGMLLRTRREAVPA